MIKTSCDFAYLRAHQDLRETSETQNVQPNEQIATVNVQNRRQEQHRKNTPRLEKINYRHR